MGFRRARFRSTIGVCVPIALAVAATFGAPAAASDVFGLWIEPDMGALVELYACGDDLCGRLVAVPASQPSRDLHNPDPGLRDRRLVGLRVVDGFRRIDDGLWVGGGAQGRQPGRIYLPLNGDTLGDADNAYAIRLESPNSLTVGFRDCLMTCVLNSTWQRMPSGARPDTLRRQTRRSENP